MRSFSVCKPSASWINLPQSSTYGLTYCFVFLQNRTPCPTKRHIPPSFVHILQMNRNSAWQDHCYRSIDIKFIQAGQWTKPNKQNKKKARWAINANENSKEKRCFCHQATLTPWADDHSVAAFCYLMRLLLGREKHFTGIFNLQNCDHKNKALDLWQ